MADAGVAAWRLRSVLPGRRLFPTQQHLFDYIDGHGGAGLLPFSVELAPVAATEHHPALFKRPRDADGGRHQTRFFLAATPDEAATYNAELPAVEQHLYEIIRDGAPCRLYLDVECSADTDAAPLASDGTPAVTAATPQGRRVRLCPFGCPHRFDGRRTAEVLMRELRAFVAELLGAEVPDHGAVVLESTVPGSSAAPVKFSQHYVVRCEDQGGAEVGFGCNSDVGGVVRLFADRMSHRAATDAEVHRALFFHGDPAEGGTVAVDTQEPSDDGTTLVTRHYSGVPLRCVIDEAVYSRNRMFRCLGSSKLGKAAALDLDRRWYAARPLPAPSGRGIFLAALITHAPAMARTFDGSSVAAAGAAESRPSAAAPHRPAGSALTAARGATPYPLTEQAVCRAAGLLVRRVVHVASHVVLPHGLLLTMGGTRYCGRVRREHRSNQVYYYVSPGAGTAAQRCFDPDCRGYQGPPVPLPPDAVAELASLMPPSHAPGNPHVPTAPTPPTPSTPPLKGLALYRSKCTRFVPAPK